MVCLFLSPHVFLDTSLQLAAAGTGGSKSIVETLKAAVLSVVNAIVSHVLALFRGIVSIFGGAGGKAAAKVRHMPGVLESLSINRL